MGYSKHVLLRGRERYVSSLVQEFSDIIVSTMGPGGDVTLIQSNTGTMATKDGVTVSKHIAPRDSFSSMISRLIIDAADRTVREVGDGTTTTVCLLSALYGIWENSYKDKRYDKRQFLKGMDAAVSDVMDYLRHSSRKVYDGGEINLERLRDVALIACNGDENMAGMISDLVYDIGINGRIMIKRNIGHTTYTERLRGYSFDTVLLGRQHLRDRTKGDEVLINPLFIMNADGFENDTEIVPVIDCWLRSEELKESDGALRPLVIVTTGLVGSARSFIAGNAERYPVYVVSPPLGGEEGWEIMTDLRDMTCTHQVYLKSAGKGIAQAFGVDFEPEDEMDIPQVWKEYGSASRCILSPLKCSIIPQDDYDPSLRVRVIEERIEKSKDEREREFLRQRVAALMSGVGVVYVGADSDAEAHKTEHAIDDAQRACFTALEGGVVSGAGKAFWSASAELWDRMFLDVKIRSENKSESSYWNGYALVLNALEIPACQIVSNFNGEDLGDSIERLDALVSSYHNLKEFWYGWTVNGLEIIEDMYSEGIIDPLLVCNSALKNAISVAKQLIHCKYALVEDKQDGGYIGAPGDELDERINKNDVREIYKKLDLLKVNKEGGKWQK